jgi:hypothetical protein
MITHEEGQAEFVRGQLGDYATSNTVTIPADLYEAMVTLTRWVAMNPKIALHDAHDILVRIDAEAFAEREIRRPR